MTTLFVLFLVGVLTGANSDRKNFRPLAALLAGLFFSLAFMWHDIHDWPGLLSPSWVAMFGKMVLAVVLGLMLGGILLRPTKKAG